MKRTILLIFLVSGVLKLNAQELDYSKVANLVIKNPSLSAIEKLKKIGANSSFKREKMVQLLNYEKLINEKKKEREEYVNSANAKIDLNNKKLREIQRKGEQLDEDAEDILRTANKHKREANMHYRNHQIAANMNNTYQKNRNYNAYQNSLALQNRYIRKYNSFIARAKQDNSRYKREHTNLRNATKNLISISKSKARDYSETINTYRLRKRALVDDIYKSYANFKEVKEQPIVINDKLKDESFMPKKELAAWAKKGNNFNETLEASKKGYKIAQRRLSRIYDHVYNDKVKGLYWRKKAAENGDAIAQAYLGNDYYLGNTEANLPMNHKEALKWYRKSAYQGHRFGQHGLGVMYEFGYEVGKDYSKAESWYRKAANQGYVYSQYFLADLYYSGTGVSKNDNEAFKWFSKAANQNNANAQNKLADMYYYGEGVDKDYAKAFKLFEKAAKQNKVNAQYFLGYMYYNGQGVAKNEKKAIEWYQKAAKRGLKYAIRDLKKLGYGDSDNDGVYDKDDKCPNDKGPKENSGCPTSVIKEENWTSQKTIYGLKVLNNDTKETMTERALEGVISIDLNNGRIVISAQKLDDQLSLSFNKNLIDNEALKYGDLDFEYHKRFMANPSNDKIAMYIVRINKDKKSNKGIFTLIIPDKTYIFYFTE